MQIRRFSWPPVHVISAEYCIKHEKKTKVTTALATITNPGDVLIYLIENTSVF
jgi:hypothetical protein